MDRASPKRPDRRWFRQTTPHTRSYAQPLRRVFYTLFAWQDRGALDTFATTQPHRDIMANLRPIMRGATFTFWEVPAERLPLSWDDAQQRLANQAPANDIGASHPIQQT